MWETGYWYCQTDLPLTDEPIYVFVKMLMQRTRQSIDLSQPVPCFAAAQKTRFVTHSDTFFGKFLMRNLQLCKCLLAFWWEDSFTQGLQQITGGRGQGRRAEPLKKGGSSSRMGPTHSAEQRQSWRVTPGWADKEGLQLKSYSGITYRLKFYSLKPDSESL